jgi:hypothetical protein
MFEYKVKILKYTAFKTEKLEANFTDELNAMAREGWRVLSTSDYMNSYLLVTFEREVKSSLPSF